MKYPVFKKNGKPIKLTRLEKAKFNLFKRVITEAIRCDISLNNLLLTEKDAKMMAWNAATDLLWEVVAERI